MGNKVNEVIYKVKGYLTRTITEEISLGDKEKKSFISSDAYLDSEKKEELIKLINNQLNEKKVDIGEKFSEISESFKNSFKSFLIDVSNKEEYSDKEGYSWLTENVLNELKTSIMSVINELYEKHGDNIQSFKENIASNLDEKSKEMLEVTFSKLKRLDVMTLNKLDLDVATVCNELYLECIEVIENTVKNKDNNFLNELLDETNDMEEIVENTNNREGKTEETIEESISNKDITVIE